MHQNSDSKDMHQAVWNRDLEKLKIIIEKNPTLIAATNWDDKGTPLHKAGMHKENEHIVEYLISKGANLYAKLKDDGTIPLHWAVMKGNTEVVKLLLQKGGLLQLEICDFNKNTPLIMAAKGGHLEIVKLLLTSGAQINKKNQKNQNPLHYAVRCGHFEIVKLLLVKGVDLNARNNTGAIPLQMGIHYNRVEIVKFLLQNSRPEDLEAKDNDGNTPMHWAALHGQKSILLILISKGAQLDSKNSCHETPLHLASREGHLEIVKLLLHRGAFVEAKTKKDEIPLHYGALYGNLEIVKYFTEQKVTMINARNFNNETPLDLADSETDDDVKKVRKYLIEIQKHYKSNEGQKPKGLADEESDLELILETCSTSYNTSSGSEKGKTNALGKRSRTMKRKANSSSVPPSVPDEIEIVHLESSKRKPLNLDWNGNSNSNQIFTLELLQEIENVKEEFAKISQVNIRILSDLELILERCSTSNNVSMKLQQEIENLKEKLTKLSQANTGILSFMELILEACSSSNKTNEPDMQKIFSDMIVEWSNTKSESKEGKANALDEKSSTMKCKANSSSMPDDIEIVLESSMTKRLNHDWNGNSDSDQNVLMKLQQEIENLKEKLAKLSQANSHPKCGFSCQYCLRVPNGLSFSLNCGHLPFCNQCSQSILYNKVFSKRVCPICKKEVISRQQVFVDLMKCGIGKNANENDTNVVVLQ